MCSKIFTCFQRWRFCSCLVRMSAGHIMPIPAGLAKFAPKLDKSGQVRTSWLDFANVGPMWNTLVILGQTRSEFGQIAARFVFQTKPALVKLGSGLARCRPTSGQHWLNSGLLWPTSLGEVWRTSANTGKPQADGPRCAQRSSDQTSSFQVCSGMARSYQIDHACVSA